MGKLQVAYEFAKKFAIKNSPSILTALGIAGMITTVIMACEETPKAMALVEKKKEEKDILIANEKTEQLHCNADEAKLTTWEYFCEGAKAYWPSAVVGSMSIACIIFANHVNLKRNAALIAAYQLSESKLKDYKEEVVKEIGKNKEQKLRDRLVQEKLDKNPPDTAKVIIANDTEVLCYDAISGRTFKSNTSNLRKIESILNRRLINESTVTLNELYYEIGLDPITVGDDLGWAMTSTEDIVEFDLTNAKVTEEGVPCIYLDYNIRPIWLGYGDLT